MTDSFETSWAWILRRFPPYSSLSIKPQNGVGAAVLVEETAMTERKIMSPSKLNAWLTAEIQKVHGCQDCELTWKYRLREPDKHGGCNWSELNFGMEKGRITTMP